MMVYQRVTLAPTDLDNSIQRLSEVYNLEMPLLSTLRRIVALFPRSVEMYLDEIRAGVYSTLPLADRFTFDIETDDLILFASDPETFIDAMIETAMYLTGFSTMIGNEEAWVIEFTIGAWKPVKNRLKRQLGIPVRDKPSGIAGLPPAPDKAPGDDPYPFRTLVSRFDRDSFYQMVVLAAREEITVYFPPETHPKVLAVYVYMRRAMQEVAKGIDITDHTQFNANLLTEIQRLENLFHPRALTSSNWPAEQPRASSRPENPFEAFIEQLLSDDDTDADIP